MENKEIQVRPIVASNFIKNYVNKFARYTLSSELYNADFVHDDGFFVGNHTKEIKKELKLLSRVLKEYYEEGINI